MNAETAIAALIHRYAELVDGGDFDGVGRLFADATYRSERGGCYQGAAAVQEVLRRLIIVYDGTPRTKHVTTNVTIQVDAAASGATARSYYTVFQATAELPLQAIIAGRYHDRFACADGVWRFVDRMIFVDLVGDLRWHLRGSIG
jgi:3-phenylpropionate/cinnamic acid dioxygenase small subunit